MMASRAAGSKAPSAPSAGDKYAKNNSMKTLLKLEGGTLHLVSSNLHMGRGNCWGVTSPIMVAVPRGQNVYVDS